MFNPFFDYPDPEPILRDVFWTPIDWSSPGIFLQIDSSWSLRTQEFGVYPPWHDYVDAMDLNREYFLNHSGGKFCSPLVKYYIQKGYVDSDGILNDTAKNQIAKILISKYAQNWKRLWDTNVSSYSPIHNYDMYEERDLATTEDETIDTDGTLARSGTESTQHGKTETITHGKTEERETSRTGTESTQYGKTETITHGKTEERETSHTGTESTQYGKTETITHGKTEDRETSHTGTDTLQHGLTETTTHGKTTDQMEYKYGINTNTLDPKPSDKVETTDGGQTISAQSGSDVQTKNLTDKESIEEGGTTATALSGTDTNTKNLTDTESIEEGGTTATALSGTDTNTRNLTDTESIEEGGTTTTALSGTDTNTRNLTDTTDETRTRDNDGTEHEEIHRYGNIGVTTTQKLLQEERQLWLWNYFDQIFSDLDKELALAFHDPCRV